MAVATKPTRTIRYFQERYHRRSLWFSLVTAVAPVAVAFITLISIEALDWQRVDTWALLVIIMVLACGLAILSLHAITQPFYHVLAALIHKTGELSVKTPPNPNTETFEKTGLQPILQAIYDSAISTEATEAEDDKTHTKTALTEALNHTTCGVVVMNHERQIISANTAAPVGYNSDGEPFLALDFLDEDTIDMWLDECEETSISAERRWYRICIDQEHIKKIRYFDIIASYEKGASAEIVIVLIDQSTRYLPEEEDLDFIAFAAHELRGPITVIRGYIDILQEELDERLKGDEPELFNRLSVSANRLSGYISNILNVAKFDRHRLQVHLYEDTMTAVYDLIADDMQMRAAAQGRLLSVTIPKNLPTVAVDRGGISEVLANLIDNALKYSFEGGHVRVNAKQKGDFIEVSVKDNGIGMPANVVNNLFHKFYRSHRSRETIAGTGIGLYICKEFVKLHGGTISVSSKENEGSTFTFTVPTYASVADKLLEDGQLNQQLIRKGAGWIKNHAMYRR